MLAATALPRHLRAQNIPKLTVGNTEIDATGWQLAIADAGGFYGREKVDVEFIYTGNNAMTVQQLLAKSLDIAKASMETAIRGIEHAAPIAMVGCTILPYPYSFFAAPSIVTPADLRGKRVVCDLPSSMLTYTWKRWVASKGLGPDDVELVFDGTSTNRFAALISGAVVAAPLNQPLDIVATGRGFKRLLDISVANKSAGFSCVIGRTEWLADAGNDEAVRRFLRATSKATDWFYDRRNRDAAVSILVRSSKIESGVAQQIYDYYLSSLRPFPRNCALPDAAVQGNIDYLVESGAIKPPAPPVAKYVDRRFLPG